MRRLTLLALVLTACSASTPALRPPVMATTPREGYTQRTRDARVTMTVTGAMAVSVTDETLVTVVEIIGGRNARATWFFSISAAEPLFLEDGRSILYSADLAPGLYTGPDTYTLSDAGQIEIEGVQSLGSGAYVQIARGEPDAVFGRFDQFGDTCTVTITRDSLTGTVNCPRLLDTDEREVALRWTWELL